MTPQKSEESEYPAMDQDEMNRLLQNAIEHAQAELQQKHEEHIKALEANREAQIKVVEDRLTKKFEGWGGEMPPFTRTGRFPPDTLHYPHPYPHP